MERITNKHLQATLNCINRALGLPTEPYSWDTNNHPIPNVGVIHLDENAYGVSLVRMEASGGTRRVGIAGYVTKREMYNILNGFYDGIQEANKYPWHSKRE